MIDSQCAVRFDLERPVDDVFKLPEMLFARARVPCVLPLDQQRMAETVEGGKIIGAEPQRRFQQLAGALRALPARLLVEERPGVHGQVDGVGIAWPFTQGTLTLCLGERYLQCVRDALCDLVMHFRELSDLSIESFRPELRGV